LIGAAIAFFGVGLLAIIAYAGWSANQTATEIERAARERSQLSIARALNEQKSVAWWDDPWSNHGQVLDMEFTTPISASSCQTYARRVYILNAKDHRSMRLPMRNLDRSI
jgi:hypothetical protein